MQTVRRILNSKGESEFVPLNNAQLNEARAVWNSNGNIDTASLGGKYVIDTLTYIMTRLSEQSFYVIRPSDYIPIEVGNGGLSDSIVTNLEFSIGMDFDSGLSSPGVGDSQMNTVEVGRGHVTMAVKQWNVKLSWNIIEIQQALQMNRWDLIEGKERARKTNYDLGIQRMAFLGLKSDPLGVPGLLTNSAVQTDLSTITKPISHMTAAEFQTFVSTVIGAYQTNSAVTKMPNRFIVPQSDWTGFGAASSSDFPINDKITYMENAFKKICGPDFKFMPLAYGDALHNADAGINEQVYMLYRDDVQALRMDVQMPYTVMAPGTADNYTFSNVAVSRFTGVGIYKPRELLKFQFSS